MIIPTPIVSGDSPGGMPVKQIGNRQVIEAIFRAERYRFDDTIIGEAENAETHEPFTLKATSEQTDPLLPNLAYRLYGQFKNHPKYGRQFVVDSWIRTKPATREQITHYLMRQAEIGSITASILFDLYGKTCLDKLREDPAAVSAAVLDINKRTRFNTERAQRAAELLAADEATESVAVELIDLLAGRGLPKGLHRKLVAKYGARANEIVRRNPYVLLQFDRVGFKSADKLYCELGLPKSKLKRQALCIAYAIENDRDGNTWMAKADVAAKARGLLGAALDFEKAVKLALRARLIDEYRECAGCEGQGKVSVLMPVATGEIESTRQDCFMCRGTGGTTYFAKWSRSQNEWAIASIVAWHNSKDPQWREWISEGQLGDLSDHQREELLKTLQGRICAFGGIPGTGKTYTMARVVRAIIEGEGSIGQDEIAVVAPTGKAAVRMTENLEAYGIGMRARTIHSLLGIANVDGKLGFDHGPSNPFEQTVFIVDETSMVDTDLQAAFFAALPAGAHVLLIGDINQLPPVGHGAPLRDLRAAGIVAQGELVEIKRQKEPGKIVEACDLIRQGRPFVVSPNVIVGTPENLGLLHSDNPRESQELVVELLKGLGAGTVRENGKLDPVWDCQVVVATNEKGELSRKSINKRLQGELNPSGENRATPFRVGDKVICLKNGFVPDQDGGDDVFVANGEIGKVTHAEAGFTNVTLWNPDRRVKIPRGQKQGADGGDGAGGDSTDTGCAFDLAYGVTCHKLQGSQAKVVIVVLDDAAKGLCTREWIYTAISRAESACWLVGKMETAHGMVRKMSLNRRKTFLVERLKVAAKKLAQGKVDWEV